MPPRAKAKIENQPKKEEMSPVVQQIKSVITPSIPIEQVVYLNDDKVVTHIEGTNRYWINYPDTWRTISNQQLILGVRAIRKFWNNVYMKITMVYRARGGEDKSWIFVFQTSFKPDEMNKRKENLLVGRINQQWTEWINTLPEDDKTTYWDRLRYQKWNAHYDGFWIVIDSPYYYDSTAEYGVYTDSTASSISGDTSKYFTPRWVIMPIPGDDFLRLTARPMTYKEINDTYLLAASFAGQTNYQYLGFTNTEFNPPKQYILPIGDTRYWIDVVSSDGRSEVELDARDLVVVELSLKAVPFQKYV